MREFTVIFRSVQELSEFMALANQQPFDVLFVRAGGVSNHVQLSVAAAQFAADGAHSCRRCGCVGVLPEYAAVSGAGRDGLKR